MEEQKKEVTLEDIAKECVSKITFDINMRSGFGAAYRMIDPSMKEEILRGWIHSVKEILEKHQQVIIPTTSFPHKSASTVIGGVK